jgi:hypothetical protein
VSSTSTGSASSRPGAGARALARRAAELLVLVLVLGGGAPAAHAAKKKIVVLDFKGPKASRAQRGVVRLLRPNATIVSHKTYARAARQVDGYAPDADGVARVAGRLRAHGVVTGKVSKRGSRYRLTLQIMEGRSGEVIGDGITVPLKRGRLGSAARRKLRRELRAVLGDLPDPGEVARETDGLVASAPDRPEESATAPAGAGEAAPAGGVGPGGQAGQAGDAAASREAKRAALSRERRRERARARRKRVAAAGEVRAGGPRRAPGGSGRGEEAGSISGAAVEADRDARGRAIDLAAGASFVSRKLTFDFADGLAGSDQPQGYSGALVPGAYAAVELYPVALADRSGHGFARDIGVSAVVDKVLLIKSKLEGEGDALPTAQTRYGVGLVYRWNFGSSPTSPTLKVSARYSKLSFSIDESKAAEPAAIEIPDVSYTYIDPGLGLRLPIGEAFAALAEARFLFVTDAGQIQDLDRYGKTSVSAFDVDVGGELKLTSNLLARAGARFTQLAMDFSGNGAQTDPTGDGTQDISSATDRYLGFYATAGVLF